MISDCGYGHFFYVAGSAFLWYMGWLYCVALLSSHGDVEGQRLGIERGLRRGGFVVWCRGCLHCCAYCPRIVWKGQRLGVSYSRGVIVEDWLNAN